VEDLPAFPLPSDVPPPAATLAQALLPRWFAAVQVFLVCGIPTQVFVTAALVVGGVQPFDGSHLSLEFFAMLSLLDTALVALLIRVFLLLSGESSHDVFVGTRRVRGEVLRGLALLPVILVGVTGLVLLLRYVAPGLHTVADSPLEGFMRTPLEAAIFMVVVVLAGGVREELQRAFILHRFDQRLGGVKVGLAVFSVLFGLLHLDQGVDVSIAVGLLGLLWGILYIRRRSAVTAMVSHAGFNAAQVLEQVIARAVGM
jgi:membrane protease YdiL (CAAX protease family)